MKYTKQEVAIISAATTRLLMHSVVIISMLLSGSARAQTLSKAASFKEKGRATVTFTVNCEANVRYYDIEGADDTMNFEKIVKVRSSGNTVIPRTYYFDVTGNEHKYYRVTAIQMNWQTQQFPLIYSRENSNPDPFVKDTPDMAPIATTKKMQK